MSLGNIRRFLTDATKQQLRDFCEFVDPQGVYQKDDNIAEFGNDISRDGLIEIIQDWENDDPITMQELLHDFLKG